MTTPLLKPIKRLVKIRGVEYVVEFTGPLIQFRKPRSRHYLGVAMHQVLAMAERLAGEEAFRENIRARLAAQAARRNGR